MVTYKYTALSNSGQKVNGVIDAFNEMDAVDRIKRNHSAKYGQEYRSEKNIAGR